MKDLLDRDIGFDAQAVGQVNFAKTIVLAEPVHNLFVRNAVTLRQGHAGGLGVAAGALLCARRWGRGSCSCGYRGCFSRLRWGGGLGLRAAWRLGRLKVAAREKGNGGAPAVMLWAVGLLSHKDAQFYFTLTPCALEVAAEDDLNGVTGCLASLDPLPGGGTDFHRADVFAPCDDQIPQLHIGGEIFGLAATDGRILFQDNFDSGLSRWTNTTNVATSNGWLIVGENHGMRSRIGADWTDYVIEAELSTNHAPAGLVFRASTDGKNHYMWQFWPAKEQLRPHKLVDGRYWVIKDIHCVDIDEGLKPFHVQSNANGGKAYFASNPTVGTLQAILDDALPVADVAFEGSPDISSGGGMLSYLHKVKDGANVYYIANSSNDPVDSRIRLRGNLKLQLWNPHTGSMIPTDCIHELKKNRAITSIRTALKPVESIFLIEQ